MDGDLRRCDRPMNVSWPRILESLAGPTPLALQPHSERLHVALAAFSARCRRRVSIPACTGPDAGEAQVPNRVVRGNPDPKRRLLAERTLIGGIVMQMKSVSRRCAPMLGNARKRVLPDDGRTGG